MGPQSSCVPGWPQSVDPCWPNYMWASRLCCITELWEVFVTAGGRHPPCPTQTCSSSRTLHLCWFLHLLMHAYDSSFFPLVLQALMYHKQWGSKQNKDRGMVQRECAATVNQSLTPWCILSFHARTKGAVWSSAVLIWGLVYLIGNLYVFVGEGLCQMVETFIIQFCFNTNWHFFISLPWVSFTSSCFAFS